LLIWALGGLLCFSRLWALKWASSPATTNFLCAGSPSCQVPTF